MKGGLGGNNHGVQFSCHSAEDFLRFIPETRQVSYRVLSGRITQPPGPDSLLTVSGLQIQLYESLFCHHGPDRKEHCRMLYRYFGPSHPQWLRERIDCGKARVPPSITVDFSVWSLRFQERGK